MKFRAFATAFVIVFGTLAVRTAVAETPAQKSDEADRVTCEITHPPGSRLGGVRRCRTQAEWAQYRAEMRDSVHRIQNQGATNCVPTPDRPNIC